MTSTPKPSLVLPYTFDADKLAKLYLDNSVTKTPPRFLKRALTWVISTNLEMTIVDQESFVKIDDWIGILREKGYKYDDKLSVTSAGNMCRWVVTIFNKLFGFEFPKSRSQKSFKNVNKTVKVKLELKPDETNCTLCYKVFTKYNIEKSGKDAITCKNCNETGKERNKKYFASLSSKVLDDLKSKKIVYNKQYCKENPEKVKQSNAAKKLNKYSRLKVFIECAENRGIAWKLTDEEAFEMMKSPCFYCGILDSDTTLNGIDRLNLNSEYISSETVSCCSFCNKLKNTIDSNVFIHVCAHIDSFNSDEKGSRINYKVFKQSGVAPFTTYKSNAKRKKRDFPLLKDEFNKMTKNPCYICGYDKSNVGIDRFDNSIGYVNENCRPCCTTCNRIKYTHDHGEFIEKCKTISKNHPNLDILKIDYEKDNFCAMAESDFVKH